MKKKLILFLAVFVFCTSNSSSHTYDECVKLTLSPGDYKKWLNEEIDLSRYSALIKKCLDGEVKFAEEVENESNADDLNELIKLLPDLIEISTNTFYSKDAVSNASANLQKIESSLIQYQNNLVNRTDISDINSIDESLENIFILVYELDLVLSYRILISEVLIYGDLTVDEENVNIDNLTTELSSIIAQSKVNYSNLPEIAEFDNHKNLVEVALVTAEDLHGRYLAALRNNEYDVAESISSAILLNKSTEVRAFENSLTNFNQKSLNIYNNLSDLP